MARSTYPAVGDLAGVNVLHNNFITVSGLSIATNPSFTTLYNFTPTPKVTGSIVVLHIHGPLYNVVGGGCFVRVEVTDIDNANNILIARNVGLCGPNANDPLLGGASVLITGLTGTNFSIQIKASRFSGSASITGDVFAYVIEYLP